jgi:hypothetical protein
MSEIKIREDRLRRLFAKHGHYLRKTPSRSWLRSYYGPGYMVLDYRNIVRLGCTHRPYDATLDQCEAFILNISAKAA